MQESAFCAIDFARLLTLVDKIAREQNCSPKEAVDLIASSCLNESQQPFHIKLNGFVDEFRRIRLRRNEMLGAKLFRDPAWDMLLDLFVAEQNDKRVSVTSLCHGSGVPPTTALRHLVSLERHGMVYREGDKSDERRCWVRPTEKALAGVGKAAALLAEQAHKWATTTEPENLTPELAD